MSVSVSLSSHERSVTTFLNGRKGDGTYHKLFFDIYSNYMRPDPTGPSLHLPQLPCSMIVYAPTKASARLHPHRSSCRVMPQRWAARLSRLSSLVAMKCTKAKMQLLQTSRTCYAHLPYDIRLVLSDLPRR